jgi:isohexenylglutaconyl-CoA hydratase
MGALPETKFLELEPDGGWLTIWLNRPQVRNALSNEMIAELTGVLEAVRDDRKTRGITLRGRGGVFCAGGDLKGFQSVFQGEMQNEKDVAAANRKAGELFDVIEAMPQVVVMLIEGAAMAGGLGMACAGDVVAVTRDAKFALTETTLGIPPAQIAPFVVQRFGLRTARRLMLTAARFTGEEAAALGLADFVADDAAGLADIERSIRKGVMRCAPGANAATKEIVLASRHLDREAMLDTAAAGFAKCMLSEEGLEGIAAFFEKRRARWVPSE